MIRFIIRRKIGDNISGYRTESLETVDINVPELEQILIGGGSGESGFDIRELFGIEIIKERQS